MNSCYIFSYGVAVASKQDFLANHCKKQASQQGGLTVKGVRAGKASYYGLGSALSSQQRVQGVLAFAEAITANRPFSGLYTSAG